jgi:hypothetical protein
MLVPFSDSTILYASARVSCALTISSVVKAILRIPLFLSYEELLIRVVLRVLIIILLINFIVSLSPCVFSRSFWAALITSWMLTALLRPLYIDTKF